MAVHFEKLDDGIDVGVKMVLLVALSPGAEEGVAVVVVEGAGSFKPTR